MWMASAGLADHEYNGPPVTLSGIKLTSPASAGRESCRLAETSRSTQPERSRSVFRLRSDHLLYWFAGHIDRPDSSCIPDIIERVRVQDTRSAHLDLSRVPRSLAPRNSAPPRVAATITCIGVRPASTIGCISEWSPYPGNRPGGPVSVPIPYLMPESASFFVSLSQIILPDFFPGLRFERHDAVMNGRCIEDAANHDGTASVDVNARLAASRLMPPGSIPNCRATNQH